MPRQDPLAAFRADLDRAVVATDFDGTLAPIVDDPSAAVPADGAIAALERLVPLVAEVAVISGRPLEHLDANLPDSVTLVGLYGLQQRRHGVRSEHEDGARWAPVVERMAERARIEGPAAMLVESKHASLTLHYRQSPESADEVEALAHRLAGETGLELRPAKMSVELHPPVTQDKGTALESIAAAADGPVMFLGDDVGDLSAFDALDRLASKGRVVVRVAVAGAETSPELLARADVVVSGPDRAVALLVQLAGGDEPTAAS